MNKLFGHLKTVTTHRRLVRRLCFKCGLIRQGLTHDLSKLSAAEFWRGVKYYQGNRSPQTRERELFGYYAAWLHHKGRNKHHYEYWTDFADGKRVYVEMPAKYLAEMVCDRIAAGKTYKGKEYTDANPLAYFENQTDKTAMNEKTCEALRYFLTLLRDKGENEMFKELKRFVKESKRSR